MPPPSHVAAALSRSLSRRRPAVAAWRVAAGGDDDRAFEYGGWARALTRAVRVVSGERRADAASVAGAAINDTAPLRGFFIVEARDATEALELARQRPHARDGTIVVRQIDTP